MMKDNWIFVLLLTALITKSGLAQEAHPNGFDVSKASIPVAEILDGKVGKDGIKSVDHPKFLEIAAVNYIEDGETVISFTAKNGETRAYPIRILNKHEIVNDKFEGQSIIVTYCPLCASAMVFESMIEGKHLVFGVSGLLYHSDVLMYDRETQSLWTQLGMQAVSGPNVGKKLKWLPSEQMSFQVWKSKYPQGKVLSLDTGHKVNYNSAGYTGYFASPDTMFPVPFKRTELRKKRFVGGVVRNGEAMAFAIPNYLLTEGVEAEVGGEIIKVSYDQIKRQFQAFEADGITPIPSVTVFWFAWQAFYPETKIWKP